MKLRREWLLDGLLTLVTLVLAFGVNMLLLVLFDTRTMIPMIFVLGVFLVSWRTQGYFWGVSASLLSVLAVNWAFTYPYWAFDLISPECISAAVVMLVVAVMTGTLTTKIKEQEKMKAEAERERMRGNLLRAVSHDLRTPLTAMDSACSVMLENYDDLSREQHRKLLEEVRSDSQWLVRMVENLLSVTRLDGGGLSLDKGETVVEELVDTLLVKFRKHYPQQRVQVNLPDGFLTVPMDAMLIQQVLMNLLENAVFHARGMTELSLTVRRNGSRAVFMVEDDGCGIPPERMENLFSGIPAAGAPSDSRRSNMGIGLSVCNAIVRAHGGELQAENRPGGGARFRFALEMRETDYGE